MRVGRGARSGAEKFAVCQARFRCKGGRARYTWFGTVILYSCRATARTLALSATISKCASYSRSTAAKCTSSSLVRLERRRAQALVLAVPAATTLRLQVQTGLLQGAGRTLTPYGEGDIRCRPSCDSYIRTKAHYKTPSPQQSRLHPSCRCRRYVSSSSPCLDRCCRCCSSGGFCWQLGSHCRWGQLSGPRLELCLQQKEQGDQARLDLHLRCHMRTGRPGQALRTEWRNGRLGSA